MWKINYIFCPPFVIFGEGGGTLLRTFWRGNTTTPPPLNTPLVTTTSVRWLPLIIISISLWDERTKGLIETDYVQKKHVQSDNPGAGHQPGQIYQRQTRLKEYKSYHQKNPQKKLFAHFHSTEDCLWKKGLEWKLISLFSASIKNWRTLYLSKIVKYIWYLLPFNVKMLSLRFLYPTCIFIDILLVRSRHESPQSYKSPERRRDSGRRYSPAGI